MSNQPTSGAGVTWRITQQVPTTGLGPTGQYVQGVRVSFTLSSGSMGDVFVPNTDFSPDRVRELVAERARAIVDVSGLNGRL